MTRYAALAVVLLLTACTDEPAPRAATPTPPPSAGPAAPTPGTSAGPTTAAAPSTPPPDGVLVAVARPAGLELYRVDRTTRVAVRERALTPPGPSAEPVDVAVTAGTVCAVWHVGEAELVDDPRTTLVCYPAGASQGRSVQGPVRPVEVALSDDGRQLAWAQFSAGENQVLATALLADGIASGMRRFRSRADQPETGDRAFTGTAVQDLAWVDAGEVAISTDVESDDGPRLLRFDVASPGDRGWLDEGEPVLVRTDGYLTYQSVVAVEGTTALAVERGSYMAEKVPPQRAVRIDLATGRVLQVLATAAEGRRLAGVSGSEAVVYVTAATPGALKAHLRLPGESRGTPITGLPADATQIVAPG